MSEFTLSRPGRPLTARARVSKAPATTADPMSVTLLNYSNEWEFEVPAAQWTGAVPAVGDRCLVIFDDDGDAWVLYGGGA